MNVPLFPLPQCVLLPGAAMPLHVFEERYCLMVKCVLTQSPANRFIAAALLSDGYEACYESLEAPIHPVVCVGQVIEHIKLEDGRYNIILRGRKRVRVLDEDRKGPFRVARVTPLVTCLDTFEAACDDVARTMEQALKRAVHCGLLDRRLVDWIAETSQSCEEMIDLVAYYLLSHDESELKQRVLEETDLLARAKLVIENLGHSTSRPVVDDDDDRSPFSWPPPCRLN